MQLSRDYAKTRRITLKLFIILYSKCLNPTLHISPPFSVGNTLGLHSKGRWFEPRVNHYFSSCNVRLLASRSLQVKTNSQNDYSVTNKIGYTALLVDTVAITVLPNLFSNFTCILFMLRGGTLLIYDHGVKGQGQL